MITPNKAAFAFKNYRVVKFSFNELATDDSGKLTIEITPKGTFSEKEGVFEISIDFKSFDEVTSEEVISATFIARFIFENKIEFADIPDYFYLNGIAIVFPYIRAFISTLTLQANVTPIILPVLNLTGLDKPLKANTKVI